MKTKQIVVCLFLLLNLPVMAELNLPVTEHYLSNGMKILAVEQPDSPVVAFALYYRVGSVDEKPGKTGIAHYCEHMMFKSTENLQGETFAKLMATIGGGHSNANTSDDRTCYHQTVAPDRLEFVLRLEAERMAHLNPTPEETASELEVVKEELRMNYLDNPQGKLRFELYQNAFDVHPYKTITIGHLDDVASITRDDLMAFQQTYYVPNNAVAVVVGRFATPELLEMMESHFECIKPGRDVVRQFPVEPPQIEEKRFELDMPVQRSLVWMGYKATAAAHPDSVALQVLATIMGRGGSSPLGRLAQGDNPCAMYVSSWTRPSLEPGLFLIVGPTLPGISPEILCDRIDAVIADIIENGVTDEQLDTARTQILASDVYQMQSCMGIANFLGEWEMVSSWRDGISLAERLETVTKDTIRDVAARYLVKTNRTVAIARADGDNDEHKDTSVE
jgi:zinc protease